MLKFLASEIISSQFVFTEHDVMNHFQLYQWWFFKLFFMMSWQFLCLCSLIIFFFHNLWNYIVKFVEWEFLNKLCVVWYSRCNSQFMFLCCFIFILQDIFEFIECDMTWIKYKFVLRGQNHLIFTCDNWNLMIRKSKYDNVLV